MSSNISMGLRPHCGFWQTSRFRLSLEYPLVMGIVNVTPDSFSSGAGQLNISQVIQHAQQLKDEGAHILDIGGESSRPGAQALTSDEEWQRISPVIKELISWNIPLSVDTYHPQTMKRALDAGVDIINDIWALRQPGALQAVSQYQCGVCLMHMHGAPLTMQLSPMTGDCVVQIIEFFKERIQATNQHDIDSSRLVLDPGIGFGKSVEQNFALLRYQNAFVQMGLPLLLGWSRKSSLGAVTGLAVAERLIPSVTAAVLAVDRGASVVRVHDVAQTISALTVWRHASLANLKFG